MGSLLVAFCVLLAQEEVIQRTDPARTQYLEAADLCRAAEELIDQNPEAASQKLSELLDKYGTLPHLECRIRVKVFADDPGSPYSFFPYQFRGRARLAAAKAAKTPSELAERREAAVRDFERSVEKGAQSSRSLLQSARRTWWDALRPLLARDGWKSANAPLAEKAGGLFTDWAKSGDKEALQGALAWVETERKAARLRLETLNRSRAADRDAAEGERAWSTAMLRVLGSLSEGRLEAAELKLLSGEAAKLAGFKGTFRLRIAVAPWARVQSLARGGVATPLENSETPLLVPGTLELGDYEIELSHPRFGTRKKALAEADLAAGKTYLLSGSMETGEFSLTLSP